MRLDEAGSDEPSVDVERLAGGPAEEADGNDAPVGDRQIDRIGVLGQAAIAQHEVEHAGTVRRFLLRRKSPGLEWRSEARRIMAPKASRDACGRRRRAGSATAS